MQIMTDIIYTTLATKQDIKDVQADLSRVKTDLENRIVQSEYRLTIKLGTIVSVALAAAVTIMKLI
jgi:hypothetical protein